MRVRLLQLCIGILVVGSGLIASFFLVKNKPSQLEVISQPLAQIESVAQIKPPTIRDDTLPVASISAQSFIAYDVASGTVMAAKNPELRLMPASTTKIMTALVAFSEYDPEEVLTVSRASEAIGHVVDFTPGEQFRVGDMIMAMMINSGNDAAVSLADHHSGGYPAFVRLMNQRVISLGLKNTHFSNVSGVEADDHYSSAQDLVAIANEAMKNPVFRDIVSTKATTITTIDKKRVHKLENLNQLLWDVPGVVGIKTGWTELAGDCLVTYVTRENHDVIVVVLKSLDRFADSTMLINWVYQNVLWPQE